MNYTPNDLHNLTVKKSVMGYSPNIVDDILDKVIEDYSAYIRENIDIKDRLSIMNESLQHYRTIEESLQNTLLIAQQTGEDIKKNAYEKADNIVKEAELRAQNIINEANREVIKIKFEYEDLRKRFHIYKAKSETLLLSQMEVLKQITEE